MGQMYHQISQLKNIQKKTIIQHRPEAFEWVLTNVMGGDLVMEVETSYLVTYKCCTLNR